LALAEQHAPGVDTVKHSTGQPTVEESQRWDDFRLVGCIACWMLGHPETPYDVQHLLSGGRRVSHLWTIPLCPAHHRAVGFVPALHIASLPLTPSFFRVVFGSDAQLLELTNRLIRIRNHQIGKRDLLSEAEISQ
jgi:hypothetical protein